MSTSVPPRDGGASTPPPLRTALANEEALKSAFLSEYAALTAEARTDLGPDAAVLSTKVVEGAFVRAWDARGRIQTPDELHKFLVDDVHHAAARALSRRAAAHRLGGAAAHTAHATAESTPEQSWAHIQAALHGEHSPGALAEAAAISRHEAAEHMVAMTKERPLWMILAVGAAVLVVLVGVVLYIDHLDADNKVARAVNAADSRVVSSIPAQLATVTLDDSTKVRLAPESKLTIPKTIGPDLRAVKLEGAANFDVAPGQKKEFRVLARDAALVAKGTSFAVRDYPGDPAVTVVVTDGSIELRRGEGEAGLTEGNADLIPDSGAGGAATPDERGEAGGWGN